VCSLRLLGALDRLDRDRTAEFVASLQKDDGHFANNPVDDEQNEESAVLSTSAAVLALHELGRLGAMDVEKATEWLLWAQKSAEADLQGLCMLGRALRVLGEADRFNGSRILQRTQDLCLPDGGLGSEGSWVYDGLSDTFWALTGLYENGLWDYVPEEFLDQAGRWVVSLQKEDGSFTQESPVVGLYFALGILDLLDRLDSISVEASTKYAESCQMHPYHVAGISDDLAKYLVGGIADRPQIGQHFPSLLEPGNAYFCLKSLEILGRQRG